MKTGKLFIIIGLLLLGVGSANADYLPLRTDMSADRPQTVVLRSDANQVQLEIYIPGVEISSTPLEGRNWDRVEIPGGGFNSHLGAPELPSFTRLIAIPATAGVSAEMEVLESETIPGVDLIPAQGEDPEDAVKSQRPLQFDMTAYSTDGFYGQNEVAVGEPALWRGVRLVPVTTNPLSYNPVTKELRVAHRYRVNIHFRGTDLRNVPTRAIRPMSHSWAKIMRSMIANFDDLAIDEIAQGSYLIVCVNDADLLNRIAPLVDWKRSKGHVVTVATFSAGSSNSTIKNIIQNAYNTWEIPPEFVLLFGDSGGSYTLPGWPPSDIDHPYTQLDGTDILADVAIGRLPASTTAEADMFVAKNLFYEKIPYTTNSNWFHQGMVAAQTNHGISEPQVARWVKSQMIEHGYTRVDTMWFSYSYNSAQFIAAMNDGMCFYEERSYLGAGVSNSVIDQMQNGRMFPYAVNLTCGTGGFSGDSEMEHFVSIGTAGSPRGAICSNGTATSGTNTRFNNTMVIGIFSSLFEEDNPYPGDALVFAKLLIYNAYQAFDAGNVSNFSLWNALAGDPGIDIFTGPIRYMTSTIPDNLTWGVNTLTLTVNEGTQPLEGATVCFYKHNELQSVGETNANGQITMPVGATTTGNVKITITKHNFYPIVDSLDVVQAGVAVGLESYTVDDDNSGGSIGDGDGRINAGETVQIPLVFKNFGSSSTATGISTTVSGSEPFATLMDSVKTFPDL
ncbi:MAG: C25 family cysteine peptidase [bacterium]|nr:C25 family cysteine peptidase [bacterium]